MAASVEPTAGPASRILQVNLPLKQRTTTSILHDETMANILRTLCEKHGPQGDLIPVDPNCTLGQLAPPATELSIVRRTGRALLIPSSSKQTNTRQVGGSKPPSNVVSKTPASPNDRTAGFVKRSVSISLGLRRAKYRISSDDVYDGNKSVNGKTDMLPSTPPESMSTNSSNDLEVDSPDRDSLQTLESIDNGLSNISTIMSSMDSIEASSEKLNLDSVGLNKAVGSSKMLKPKLVRPRSISVQNLSRPKSTDTSPSTAIRTSVLPSPLQAAQPDDIFVKILLSNNQHTLIKAREDSVIEDILREVCSRKNFDFDAVTLEFTDSRMPVEMDRKIGYYKQKEYIFRLVLSDVKSYTSMIVSEDGRDVMLLTNVDGRLELIAASPDKLVEQITDGTDEDLNFINIMLMGYRSVMTAEEFLGYLVDRFNAEQPANPTESERMFYATNIIIVRSRVLDVIYHWVSRYWTDFQTHPSLRKSLQAFVDAVRQQLSGAHESILEAAGKVQAALAEKEVALGLSVRSSKSMSRKSKMLESQLFQTKTTVLAQQLCVLNHSYLCQVGGVEYLSMVWNKLDDEELWEECPNLAELIDRFNRESAWVATEILEVNDLPQRVKALTKIIEIVKECLDLNNFFSVFAILTGLNSAPILRLRKTWAGLSNSTRKLYEDLEKLTDPSKNMARYREAQAKSKPPLIPFLPIIIKDLTFMNDGNPTLLDGLVNFDKLSTMTGKVMDVVKTLRTPYSFVPNANVINYLRSARMWPKERLMEMANTLESRE